MASFRYSLRFSQTSHIAADILEAHYVTTVSLLNGMPEGRFKVGNHNNPFRRASRSKARRCSIR